jgi:hypothetical protein
MATGDWAFLTSVLGGATVDRGVTVGIPRPNGGGTSVYGFNSLSNTAGVVALNNTQSGFAPAVSGGSIRGAIQRGVSAGPENFAPFLFICLAGQDVADTAYMLGLGDDDPHHIVLRKGALVGGLPDLAPDPDGNTILMRSTATYTPGTWLHLRLDAIAQGSGDVVLQVFQNDLGANTVSSPVWTVVPGMEGPQYPTITGFVDDGLGINTGSAPLIGGRSGFGFQTSDVQRRGFIDHVVVGRQ